MDYASELDRTRDLVKTTDWYLPFIKLRQQKLLAIGAIEATYGSNIDEATYRAKTRTLIVFEQLLAENQVRLGHPGEEELDDQDKDREPIDTVVIHHSSRAEGIAAPTLNAMHLLQLYLPVYQSKKNPVLNSKGEHQPIYSGHFTNNQQVFYGYHWKVDQDGTATRLLDDSAIGWHAGNWDINKKSVGICIDDDLEDKDPTPEALQAVADLIKTHYAKATIVGHNEAALKHTICPGDGFLNSWKLELLGLLR